MRHLKEPEVEAIERMIDATSVGDVMVAISVICSEKAVHVRVNYGDMKLARQWDNVAKKIDRFIERQGADIVFMDGG